MTWPHGGGLQPTGDPAAISAANGVSDWASEVYGSRSVPGKRVVPVYRAGCAYAVSTRVVSWASIDQNPYSVRIA